MSRRRERRRNRENYCYLSPFNILNKKKRSIDKDFLRVGTKCHTLLTEGYDFCFRFSLKPDENTEVNAVFENEVTLHRQRQSLNFDRTGSGAAEVRLKDNFFLFVAQLSTLESGRASTFVRVGNKNSYLFCDANTLLDAEKPNASTKFGGAFHNETASGNVYFDLMKNCSIGGSAVFSPTESIRLGVRSQILQARRSLEFRVNYRGESYHEMTGQPQEYSISLSGDISGRHLSASYLHNMIVPFGNSLHRLSMGGEFTHKSDKALFYNSFLENNNNSDSNKQSFSGVGSYDSGLLFPTQSRSSNILTVGALWQPFENLLGKFRLDVTGNIGALMAIRSSWSAANVMLAGSAQLNMLNRDTVKVGCFLSMDSS